MTTAKKVGVVVLGYVLSFLIALAVVAIHIAATNTPEAQASSGMYAYGDFMLFLFIFGIGSILPTCTALYFLIAIRKFWSALSKFAYFFTVTGIICLAAYFYGRSSPRDTPEQMIASFSVLRFLLTPFSSTVLFISACFCPNRFEKNGLFLSSVIEVMVLLSILVLGLFAG